MEDSRELYKGTLVIKERRFAELDHIESIASFDEEYLELVTKYGNITVIGKGMTIISLDKDNGRISISGIINEISFSEKRGRRKGGGLFS